MLAGYAPLDCAVCLMVRRDRSLTCSSRVKPAFLTKSSISPQSGPVSDDPFMCGSLPCCMGLLLWPEYGPPAVVPFNVILRFDVYPIRPAHNIRYGTRGNGAVL